VLLVPWVGRWLFVAFLEAVWCGAGKCSSPPPLEPHPIGMRPPLAGIYAAFLLSAGQVSTLGAPSKSANPLRGGVGAISRSGAWWVVGGGWWRWMAVDGGGACCTGSSFSRSLGGCTRSGRASELDGRGGEGIWTGWTHAGGAGERATAKKNWSSRTAERNHMPGHLLQHHHHQPPALGHGVNSYAAVHRVETSLLRRHSPQRQDHASLLVSRSPSPPSSVPDIFSCPHGVSWESQSRAERRWKRRRD